MFKRKSNRKQYWFTIVAANGEPLATSEMYTTAAMRDNGIEAVKKVVCESVNKDVWARFVDGSKSSISRKRDTFHLENKQGKITKR